MSTTLPYRTFVELESALPGGFTGSRLTGVTLRPQEQVLELAFEMSCESAEPEQEKTAEGASLPEGTPAADTRTALVRVSGVAWMEFEPRDPKAGGKKATMVVASDSLDGATVAGLGFPPVPPGAFAHRLHAQGTDGAMCFAAQTVTLEWSVIAPD